VGIKIKESEKLKFKKILRSNGLNRRQWCERMGFKVNDIAQIFSFVGRRMTEGSKYLIAIKEVLNTGEVRDERT
jgi:hypothetical protein